jgi:hypothetical protein
MVTEMKKGLEMPAPVDPMAAMGGAPPMDPAMAGMPSMPGGPMPPGMPPPGMPPGAPMPPAPMPPDLGGMPMPVAA